MTDRVRWLVDFLNKVDPAKPITNLFGNDRKDEPAFLYLTTTGRRSGQPREIEIWFTRRDGRFYLIAETGERAHWVRNLRADSRVGWRVGDAALTGRAQVVDARTEPALLQAARSLSREKYGWGDGLVVELAPEGGVG